MIRELKDTHTYKKTMLILSVLTFFSGLIYSVIGEISLPFSAAFLAALFLYEKPQGRILSYIIPAVTVLLNVLIDGLYGLLSVEYVIIALVMVLVYRFGGTKAECAIYLTVIVGVFVLLSLYLGAGRATGSFSVDTAFEYYNTILSDAERQAVEIYSSAAAENQGISPEEIDLMFHEIRIQTVSLLAAIAFLISGITIKLFAAVILRVSKRGILISFAHFLPTNITAYSYAIILVLSIFSGTESTFGIVMLNLSNVLMLVFAYIGVRYVLTMARMSNKRGLINALLIASIVMLSGVALRILSLLGAWAVIGTNNTLNMKDES